MIDPMVALRQLLLASAALELLVDGRIYVAELPATETREQPRRCVLLRASGGDVRASHDTTLRPRVDVWSMGASFFDASDVDRAVYDMLKATNRATVDEGVIHGVAIAGGPITMRDPDTGWPVQWRSIELHTDEREVVV